MQQDVQHAPPAPLMNNNIPLLKFISPVIGGAAAYIWAVDYNNGSLQDMAALVHVFVFTFAGIALGYKLHTTVFITIVAALCYELLWL